MSPLRHDASSSIAAAAPQRPVSRMPAAAGAAVALLATLVAYFPVLRNGFTNWDDPYYVTANPAIRSLSWASVGHFFSSVTLMYHPLTMLSLAVEYRLFGLDPRGYHAVSLGLHLANTLLVFGLVRLLGGSRAAALAGSLLFGVHPVHVESVAWIAERKDLLGALFFFGALGSYLGYRQGRRPRLWYALALVLLTASLLSKPMAVTFPLVAYLCDYLAWRRIDRRAHLEKLPFFFLAGAFGVVTLVATTAPAPAPGAGLAGHSVFVAAHSLLFYLGKAAFPVGLSALYPYPGGPGGLTWTLLLSPLAVAALFLAVVAGGRATRRVSFGSLFFALTLLPVLVPRIGPHAVADRYFYIPSFGLCWLAGAAFSRLAVPRVRGRAVAAAALALVVVLLGLLTRRRTQVWHDSLTLWTDVIRHDPGPGIAYRNRGLERLERGDPAGSLEDLDRYLAAFPFDADALRTRGNVHLRLGDPAAALVDFDRAVAARPDYAEALNNRGALLAARGELARAVQDFDRALAARPRYVEALLNRARARDSLGDRAGAAADRARVDGLTGTP